MSDTGTQQRMPTKKLCVTLPREVPSPRPSVKPFAPQTPDAPIELPQAPVVRRAAVVLVLLQKTRAYKVMLGSYVHGFSREP